MPRKRKRTPRSNSKKKYDWVSLLIGMGPGDQRIVRLPKKCHLASNPPLVAAQRLGIRITTSCDTEVEPATEGRRERRTSVLTITRMAEPLSIP